MVAKASTPETHEQDQQVVAFVAHELAINASRLTATTDIVRDLGVDGADGADFMLAFGERFRVDLSSFDVSRYFGPEAAFNPLAMLFPGWWRQRRLLHPLTVGALIQAAKDHTWPTDSANGPERDT